MVPDKNAGTAPAPTPPQLPKTAARIHGSMVFIAPCSIDLWPARRFKVCFTEIGRGGDPTVRRRRARKIAFSPLFSTETYESNPYR